ncbi:MAG: carbon-nitrogen hydrolase family protein, partial [Staphylothermus sp.]|nr:carbon-nitrogen hydrolase family protein [Staphylothermus sp.]
MRWNEEVLIKRPFENQANKPSIYLGLIHAHVYLEDKKGNLDNARRLVYLASEQHLDTIIFPYMQPYGPIIERDLTKYHIRKKYGLSFASGYLYNLNIMAKNYGVNVIIPGVVEKTGSKLYISAIYIHGTIGEEPEKYRKMILYEDERKIG